MILDNIKEIIDLIDNSILDDPNQNITGGNIIKSGFDEEIDNYRNIINNSKDFLAEYQKELIEKTKISNLKIKYTNIGGYFIEIPKKDLQKIPDDFVHKQSLASVSRFITQKLKEFEQVLLEGEVKMQEKEYEIFCKIRDNISLKYNDLKKISKNIANIDFITSLSKVAYKNNYKKPEISKDYDLELINARHPIIEQIEKEFISNSLTLTKKDYIHIITGPNMGGKSTFLRQNALIILMAHIGSFVPINSGKIPLTDKIFSRVGAGDNLFLGQSTFLVEMQEMANILNNSSKNSFIIIDEIGRGTSTYDGMSLAWAILKDLAKNKKVKTLFATHYHELVDESKKLSGVSNYSVAVSKNGQQLIFLRKIIPGGAKKSYGIEVAKIAGLGENIIEESKKMLEKLEKNHLTKNSSQLIIGDVLENKNIEKKCIVEEELKNININDLTPLQALNLGNKLKNM